MQTNAVAGPSTLYLPPTRPPAQQVYIKSTNDLLSQFYLKDAYDKYVNPSNDPTSSFAADKGKGKEVAQEQDDDEPTGKGEKMKKNGYRHLIKSIPGKHSTKKDDYLTSTMQAAPKQRVRTVPFDTKTQTDAFEVSLEGLKGWNQTTLIVESAQAREDRKRRKELKKAAKAQMQGQSAMQLQTPTQANFTQNTSTPKPFTPTVGSASTPVSLPARTSTPQPQKSQFSSTPQSVHPTTSTSSRAIPPSTISRSSTPSTATASGGSTVHNPNPRNHVPTPVQIPTQKVGTPRTATPTTAAPHPLSAPPLSAKGISSGTVTPGVGQQQIPRGKKRELEDSTPVPQPPQTMNGLVNGNSQAPVKLAGIKAGNNGVRPRPVKKQRMDSNGLARDATSMPPVQQPTPQGV